MTRMVLNHTLTRLKLVGLLRCSLDGGEGSIRSRIKQKLIFPLAFTTTGRPKCSNI